VLGFSNKLIDVSLIKAKFVKPYFCLCFVTPARFVINENVSLKNYSHFAHRR